VRRRHGRSAAGSHPPGPPPQAAALRRPAQGWPAACARQGVDATCWACHAGQLAAHQLPWPRRARAPLGLRACRRRRRAGWALASLLSISAYWLALGLLWRRNPVATLYTLLLPYGVSTLALMLGNWWAAAWRARPLQCRGAPASRRTLPAGLPAPRRAPTRLHQLAAAVCVLRCMRSPRLAGARGLAAQLHPALPAWAACALVRSQHIFINPDCPDDPHGITYNCIACPDNARTYNDGYHILHHLNSRLHWRQLPAHFLDTLADHDDRDGACPGDRRPGLRAGRPGQARRLLGASPSLQQLPSGQPLPCATALRS